LEGTLKTHLNPLAAKIKDIHESVVFKAVTLILAAWGLLSAVLKILRID
jgi:hypothetical protein